MSESKVWVDSTLQLLRELMVGTADDDPVWITDGGRANSLLGTLEALSAEQASTVPDPSGATVAGLTGHILFIFQFGNTLLRGEKPDLSWEDSWSVGQVNEEEWTALRADLQEAYEETVTLVNTVPKWTHPMLVQGTLSYLPHIGYHFGAIRQRVKVL